MKKIAFLHKTFLLIAMIGFAMTGYAQQYEVDRGKVYFENELLMYADARSFKDLGYGYAKDHYNVYLNGQVLENVDPSTFRLKHSGSWRHREDSQVETVEPPARRGYFKTTFNVYYGDKKIDAMPSTFKELGGGYAKDSFTVFYCGEKVEGAMASTFKYTGEGYGQDTFDAYFRGKKIGK